MRVSVEADGRAGHRAQESSGPAERLQERAWRRAAPALARDQDEVALGPDIPAEKLVVGFGAVLERLFERPKWLFEVRADHGGPRSPVTVDVAAQHFFAAPQRYIGMPLIKVC